jgi:hypothetical protein
MSLPRPYLDWWIAVLGEPPPAEPLATCHDCPMCRERAFLPSIKCCGYVPALPSFRAGDALRAGGEAAEFVERRLRTGQVTNRFLLPTADEEAAYDRTRMRFGQTSGSKCAYVTDRGTCGIWAQRNATCATWFCKHDHGPVGAALWDAASELFRFAEQGLAVLCTGDEADPAVRYRRASERAETVSWADIRACGGPEMVALENALRAAWTTWKTHRDTRARQTAVDGNRARS